MVFQVSTDSGGGKLEEEFTVARLYIFRFSLSSIFRYTRYCRYSCFVLLKMGDSETRNM
jgi:hypothetical protein